MKIIHGIRSITPKRQGSVVTVGVFDGVHVGHRRVLERVTRRAKQLGLRSVAVTFDPHPAKVVHPKAAVPSIQSLRHRISVMRELGIDYVVVLNFSKAMACVAPEKFVNEILIRKLGMKEMWVGENFFFGKGGLAGQGELARLSGKYGFRVEFVKPVRLNGKVVSSSRIRELIVSGRIEEAAKLLGRPVSILGTVVHGAKRGRLLGFPTANINPHHEAIPPTAVYVSKAVLDGKTYGTVLNIGTRPTFHRYSRQLEPTIEAHLLGFKKDIYGKDIELLFLKTLRKQFKYASKEALMAQIAKDVAATRKILYNYR